MRSEPDTLVHVDLGSDDPAVLGVKVIGRLTGCAMAELVERIRAIRASGRKARLYVDLTRYEGYELAVVGEKLAHFSTIWNGIERCAYVIDRDWLTAMVGLVDAVTPMHLRAFESSRDAEARSWIRQTGMPRG